MPAADLTFTGATDGDITKAANWAPAQAPVNGDNLTFDSAGAHNVDANLDQSALVPGDLLVKQTFLYEMGTAAAYFKIGMPTGRCVIGGHDGVGSPAGSGRLKIDFYKASGTTPGPLIVENTKTSGTDANKPPVRIFSDDADLEVFVRKGKVGLGTDAAGESPIFGDVHVDWVANRNGDASVQVGPGATIGDFIKTGGTALLQCAATNVENHAGELTIEGTGAVALLTVYGGTCIPNSTGLLSRANCYGGLTDWTRSSRPRVVTDLYTRHGASYKLDPDVLTVTNPEHHEEPSTISIEAA